MKTKNSPQNIMITRRFLQIFGLLVVVIGFSAANIHAAIVQANSVGDWADYTVSTTDLINNDQSTYQSMTASAVMGFGNIDNVNDGILPDANLAESAGLDGSAYTVTFTLDTSVNTLGYDITSVDTYAAWSGLRANQSYQLLYSVVGSVDFISLGGFTYGPNPGAQSVSKISLTSDSSAPIATGVDQVQFIVANAGANGTIWGEWDVLGVATVPEPSGMALVGLGSLLLFGRRRMQVAAR